MKDVISTIEELQALVRKHRNSGFNELTTRTMFIDKLLGELRCGSSTLAASWISCSHLSGTYA